MRGSRFAPGAEQSPYFFLSHAAVPPPGEHGGSGHPPPDKNVLEFYTDLRKEVARLAGTSRLTTVGYLDAPGRDKARTARALHRCHSFVPLISRRYFSNATCGRQWYAFTHRDVSGVLVPVLWTPVPTAARPVVVDLDLPTPAPPAPASPVAPDALELYAQDGMYGLRLDPENRTAYQQCVGRIAQCVVQAARHVRARPPADAEPADLDDVPDAFAAAAWHPLGIAVLAPDIHHLPPGRTDAKYGPEPGDWQPFSDGFGTPLAARTAELARNIAFAPEIRTFDEAEAVFLGKQEPTCPWVLILDPWILYDRSAVERLRAFDARDLPWVTVLTPLADDTQTAQARSRLKELLRTALPRRLSRGRAIQRAAVAGIENSEAFNSRFMELANNAAQQYLNRVPLPSPTRSLASATWPDADSGGPAASAPRRTGSQGDQEAQP
ncbi:FxsC protein [Streptomyces sp. NPDC046197]|uniref:FxsC protein n=1 Tax=Streptomyces sp. NPDC046197 TaxID=3154337 RepID=UPI0033D6470A